MIYRTLLIVAALIVTATIAMAQPNVPTINVDTLTYLGKTGGGEAGGALFLPDGNIIALWKGRPLIIDSKSGEVLRQLDVLAGDYFPNLRVSPKGKFLIVFSNTKSVAIWDIASGKILKYFENSYSYCFSPDETKLYIIGDKSGTTGVVRVYDLVSLEEIEEFGPQTSGFLMDISPDGQTLAMTITKKPNGSSDTKTSQIILINLNDKKNYTVIETMEPGVYSLEFSPDGKQVTSLYSNGNYMYIYIYNLETKEKKYIREEELSTLLGINIKSLGYPHFIDNNNILFEACDWPITKNYNLTWNIPNNIIKNIINFKNNCSVDDKDSLILLCNQLGVIAILNKNVVPVKEDLVTNESFLTFNNNQLEFNSDIVFIGESIIYDTNGKQIANLGTKAFLVGRNIILINQPLPIGVYILTIKSDTNKFSYKFLVE